MLCSICNKNTAVIFINKQDETGKQELQGLCYECAKAKGINPIDSLMKQANLSENDLNDMTKQLETIVKDMANNIDLSSIDPSSFTSDDSTNFEDNPTPQFSAIPLGSIFSNMFGENAEGAQESSSDRKKVKVDKKVKDKKKKALDTFGTNLTNKAKNNQLDMVVGRDKEIQRIIQILNRRSKNNPCLIGEPGVGKTAIAQGLAIKIANGNVPAKLLNKEVYLLDMTSVIAGTQFRGQFEARMKSIIDECKNLGNIILVIDEIHNIIGAGDAEHSMNAADILKPSLSNGEIQLVGTTTLKEYRKYIEKDSALERRFQPVIVEEPSITDSIDILEGIKKYYEEFHKVKISTDVIKQAVIMSEKYIHDRFLPDKAIDILDEACSRINLNNKELYQLEILKNQLKDVQEDKEEAASADSTEDYKKAAELKAKECSLTEQIDALNAKMQLKNLTVQDIAEVIASSTGIPAQKISQDENEKLKEEEKTVIFLIDGLEEILKAVSSNKNQQKAIEVLCQGVLNTISARYENIGLIIFIRSDMAQNAITVNYEQFRQSFAYAELKWSSAEALKLAVWLVSHANSDFYRESIPIENASQEIIDKYLEELWGLKLGKKDSNEAYSSRWILAALSDFNGQLQARDIIRFLKYAAGQNMKKPPYDDRILMPAEIRYAVPKCSNAKISDIKAEYENLKPIFEKLEDLPTDEKTLPMNLENNIFTSAEEKSMTQSGYLKRDGEKLYLPEIIRHALGFRYEKGARPRVLSLLLKH